MVGLGRAVFSAIKKTIQIIPGVRRFPYEKYLQKVLSKFRILTLRTENKTGHWLEKLRQRANKKNNSGKKEKDNYWEELKKAKK